MMLSSLLLAETVERTSRGASEEFGKMDPTGLAMGIIAMLVIFVALILLLFTFKYVAKLYNTDLKKRHKKNRPEADDAEEFENIPGETLAAISLALHLYHEQLLGMENAVITFKNAAKTYSPWSSKIYGLRRTPNH